MKGIFLRFPDNVKEVIENWVENIINSCDETVLKSENKFFNNCWKPHRDELSEI